MEAPDCEEDVARIMRVQACERRRDPKVNERWVKETTVDSVVENVKMENWRHKLWKVRPTSVHVGAKHWERVEPWNRRALLNSKL